MSQLEVVKILAEPKALEILEYITDNELVNAAQIRKKFGNHSYPVLKKLESKQLIYQVIDPLTNKAIYKPTLRSKEILSAIFATLQDIEAA